MATQRVKVPVKGRVVMYHHAEDGTDWPATVLDGPKTPEGQDALTFMLEVHRPRATFWKWTSWGSHWGQWAWPTMGEDQFVEVEVGSIN